MIGQLDLDDYEVGFKDISSASRISALFPTSELLGYSHFFDWTDKVDYFIVLRLRGIHGTYYSIRFVTLYTDGTAHRGYIDSEDFTPASFAPKGPKPNTNTKWEWRSVEDRESVFEVATKNHKKELGKFAAATAKERLRKPEETSALPNTEEPNQDPNQLELILD